VLHPIACAYPIFVHIDFARVCARATALHPWKIGRPSLEIQAPIPLR
jgi:hypothetical protein